MSLPGEKKKNAKKYLQKGNLFKYLGRLEKPSQWLSTEQHWIKTQLIYYDNMAPTRSLELTP